MRRGPYLITHVLDETDSARDAVLQGLYLDLFEADLPVRQTVELRRAKIACYMI